MTWHSLSNDTRNATNKEKPQSKIGVGGTTPDCGFNQLSMSIYNHSGQRDFGPDESFEHEYSGNAEGSG